MAAPREARRRFGRVRGCCFCFRRSCCTRCAPTLAVPCVYRSLSISACIRTHDGREGRQASDLMRVTFRCDPALIDELARPIPARGVLPEWLRAMPRVAYSDTHGQEVRTV